MNLSFLQFLSSGILSQQRRVTHTSSLYWVFHIDFTGCRTPCRWDSSVFFVKMAQGSGRCSAFLKVTEWPTFKPQCSDPEAHDLNIYSNYFSVLYVHSKDSILSHRMHYLRNNPGFASKMHMFLPNQKCSFQSLIGQSWNPGLQTLNMISIAYFER